MAELAWQKSSYSSGDGNTTCIELAQGEGTLHLRESDDPDIVLTPDPRALRALFRHLKGEGTGELG